MNPSVKTAFDSLVKETGFELKHTTVEVLQYVEERTAWVQQHSTDPAYGEMLAAEARNSMQWAGIEAAHAGDAVDANARGKFFGFLLALLSAGTMA